MPNTITNFQYVGYLSDFLATYNDIDILTEQYKCAKSNFDNANTALQEYNNTFSPRNCLIGWCITFAVFLLSFPILFLPNTNALIWLLFCAINASVIIVVSNIIYKKKVLPIHRAFLQEELLKAEQAYQASYEALISKRSNLKDLRGELDEMCTYPLSIYMMREAAKEGACSNIPQGIRYFKNRYITLENAKDDSAKSLKKRIDDEQEKAKERQAFLDVLDENTQTLFK